MSTKVLGRLFIQGSRAFQRQTTRQSSDSFDAYRARLDRRMEQIRVLPTAEKDMEWEAPTPDQDSTAATASDGATRKFYDLSLRYGHQVTGLRLRRFKLLATHHSLNVNKWTKLLLKCPDRLDAPAQDLMAFVDFCTVDLKVSKSAAFELVAALPLVLFERPEVYRTLLINWVGLCEQYGVPFSVVAANPDILGLNPTDWTERIEDLSQFFRLKKDLGLLLANNPSLLTHDGKVLKAKIDFLLGDMCVKPLDIVHSSVFHVDIASIKKRFLFLDRCGLYIRPKLSDVGTRLSAEPHISKIADGTDVEFVAATTHGRLTIAEFDAFVAQLLPEETELQVDEHELAKQREEEEMAGEEGYHHPSFGEDIDETYTHLHDFVGRTEKFSKR